MAKAESPDKILDGRFWSLTNRRMIILLADTMKAAALSDDYNPHWDTNVPLVFFGAFWRVMLAADPVAAEEALKEVEQMKLRGKATVLFGHVLEEK